MRHLNLVLTLLVASSVLAAEVPIAKISVLVSGEVLLDGKLVGPAQMDAALEKLAASRGVVWYYREAAYEEPHPRATAVVDLIIKHQLPVSMSTRPDFTDVVGADGQVREREP